jgi:membrane protein insertase Oxa1/YidC/SpoIIIJ
VQPQPPAMTPEQEQQKKMMQWMSLLFSLFFYWMPSGLNLYILTSSTIAIFESKRIREHIKRKEEQDKANRVIIDAKPTRQGKQNQKQDKSSREPTKATGLAGWWMKMQDKVEQMRREAERKAKR